MAGSRFVTPYPQPVQSNGLPYAGGQLFFYLTGTSTPTPTYSNSGLTIPNTNPVILDSAGDPGNVFLDPGVVYKVVLEDANNNLIWTADPVYPFAPSTTTGLIWGGVSTGSANAQIVAAPGFSLQPGQTVLFVAGFTNLGAMTLNAGTGPLPVYQPTTAGPSALAGGEVFVANAYLASYNPNLNSGGGGFQLSAPFSLAALGAATIVKSFNGRNGVVVPAAADYTTAQLTTATLLTPPSAGQLGETISATGTAVGLTNNTATNVTSCALTPGHWRCSAFDSQVNTTQVTTAVKTSISLVSATSGATFSSIGGFNIPANNTIALTPPDLIVRLSAGATVYLVDTNGAIGGATATSTLTCQRID